MNQQHSTNGSGGSQDDHPNESNSFTVNGTELIFMIYRFLLESGLQHAAFVLWNEGRLQELNVNQAVVPPGTLLMFVQRGLDFLTLEEGARIGTPLSLLQTTEGRISLISLHRYMCNMALEDTSDDICLEEDVRVPEENVIDLTGHNASVFSCQWDRRSPLLASSSGDSTGRLWLIPERFPELRAAGQSVTPEFKVLKHKPANSILGGAEVRAVGWNMDGRVLATGATDGVVRLWAPNGALRSWHNCHSRPIVSLKWNKSGTIFATGATDGTVIIRNDVFIQNDETEGCLRRFRLHEDSILDITWNNDDTFATSGADSKIHVCNTNVEILHQSLSGHQGHVNVISFSPDERFLASGADDKTVKIWCCRSYKLLYDLKMHDELVSALDWAPQTTSLKFASGSFDCKVKIWEMDKTTCTKTMEDQQAEIQCLKYSPNGKLLASGAIDGRVIIWCTETGRVVRTHRRNASVLALDWFYTSEMLAICFSSGLISVVDVGVITEEE